MAGSINKVILIGNLGADPEIRHTQDGRPIANMRIATSETWRDKNTGERREKTEWHTIVIFSEGLCKVVEQYVKKGSKVYLEGALQTRTWEDRDGNTRYTTEVVLKAFNSTLVMLDGASGNRPPPAGSEDDYGTQSTRDESKPMQRPHTGFSSADYQRAKSGDANAPSFRREGLDDEVPF